MGLNFSVIYLALLLVLFPLGLLSLRERVRARRSPRETIDHLHQRISHHLALSNWTAAGRLIKRLNTKEALRHPFTHQLSIRLLRSTGQWEAALAAVQEGRRHLQGQLLFCLEEGRTLMEMGEPGRALEVLRRCRSILRDESDRLLFAQALFQTGDLNATWEALEPMLEKGSGRVHALAGDCLFAQKRYQQALYHFESALEHEMDNLQLLARVGHCLIRVGRLYEAEGKLRQILEVDSGHLFATLSLGCCLEEQERYEDALAIYQGGTAWELSDYRILRQAGICAFHIGHYSFAEICLKRAFELGAQQRKTLAFLAYSLECQEKWGEAEGLFRQLIAEYPETVIGYRGLAWLYGVGLSVTVTAAEGLENARKSVDLLPDSASWEVLSACEARAGNFTQAHYIQECLSSQSSDRDTRRKRLRAMRSLRQGVPLNEELVERALVA